MCVCIHVYTYTHTFDSPPKKTQTQQKEDRRAIEAALFGGELLGVTATCALELGTCLTCQEPSNQPTKTQSNQPHRQEIKIDTI